MKKLFFLTFMVLIFSVGFDTAPKTQELYNSDNLIIKQISKHAFIHISYLDTNDYGKVPCNGMIVIDYNEALVIDTPTNAIAAKELIKWISSERGCKIIGVVPTHFHTDCLGSLEVFHRKNIPSYANNGTLKLAKLNHKTMPLNGFDDTLEIKVGNKKVVNKFLGEGHTRDNIVCYFAADNVLFGGCLIKAIGASKGNLEDANIKAWSNSVEKVKSMYGDAKIIIPGHGEAGGKELLDYTIKLFNN